MKIKQFLKEYDLGWNKDTYTISKATADRIFNQAEEITLNGWKGKSDLKILENKDGWRVTNWQKQDPDGNPRKIVWIYTPKEIKALKSGLIISKKNLGNEFKSKDFAFNYYKILGVSSSLQGKPFFNKGEFLFNNLFISRTEHCKFTIMLRVLRDKKLIEYKGGRIKILRQIR